jgi:hypothetical protein
LSTKIRPSELARRGCIILLAAPLLLTALPAFGQNTDDRWQAEKRLAISKLRDCVATYSEQGSKDVQNANWNEQLIAAIEGDCRPTFDGMIRLFGQRSDAKEIEVQLQLITETTLLPAVKGEQDNTTSSAEDSTSATSQIPDPALTSQFAIPDRADRRRALKKPSRGTGTPAKSSSEWLDHCRAKYNSFNPRTGKYKSYNGVYRACR